ncbi:hypothetical protein [Nostoc sp. UHCC 0926]|uniref:hypothetical protein n=1 Tax=Nostoc sp. UHCC 0926 TaxID=3025190 RepID=UPI002360DBF5|nr:hypothetical protein [Nostoc sp. UHCC 0926]
MSKYWEICRINPASEKAGYEYRLVPQAQEFFHKKFEDIDHLFIPESSDIQVDLLLLFHNKNSADVTGSAKAGFCLRCAVSYPILKACKKIDSLFAGEKSFSYLDLLPYVLNDDGQTPIVLNSDRKIQIQLDRKGEFHTTSYKFFSVEVLRTFQPTSNSMSLDNWAYLQTKQNPEIKDFLSEFGFQKLSDWALLNRSRAKQIKCLSVRARHLVEIFHAVYRRDRRQYRQKGAIKCPDPTFTQLQQILTLASEQSLAINDTTELLQELKQIAIQLRQYDIWSYREPLEIRDPDTGSDILRKDLPHDFLNELDIEQLEQQDFLEFLHQQLQVALVHAIEEEILVRISLLKKSKKYAVFTQKFLPGLQLYYDQKLSLKDITPLLGMTSWDQARRILNPGDLINNVRQLTVQQMLDKTLEKGQSMGLTKTIPEPDYLKTLVKQIEAFADQQIFQEAIEEIRAGKNREMNSLYAWQLRLYLEQHT